MKTNILEAIINIIDNNLYSVKKYKEVSYRTRVNNTGEALENIIKDSLCNSFMLEAEEKIVIYNEYFSSLGNQNNPPDLIIRNGDALEIKKMRKDSTISLNSSFPKNKLYRNSAMLTKTVKYCKEAWDEKDICYVIGSINDNEDITNLWFLYGDCYCANPEVYTRVKTTISTGIEDLGIELGDTNEIARINRVDPLGVTYLRVRGMWGIEHPNKVFSSIFEYKSHSIKVLMKKDKFYSFNNNIRKIVLDKLNIKEIKIQNPNNPAELIDTIFIEYKFN